MTIIYRQASLLTVARQLIRPMEAMEMQHIY